MGKIFGFLLVNGFLISILYLSQTTSQNSLHESYSGEEYVSLLNKNPIVALEEPLPYFEYDESDVVCLAKNLYHEARGEPIIEILSVAQVTLNRVFSPRFPSTVCEVVYQDSQFSWTLRRDKSIKDRKSYARMKQIAEKFLQNKFERTMVGDADHYHHRSIRPHWSKYGINKVELQSHIYMAVAD